jgi:hypothetical protein
MDLCILHQEGERLRHRHLPAGPDPFLKAIAPARAARVVGVEGLGTWDGLAERCAHAGLPCVLGPALYLHARSGGPATHEQSAAQPSALLLRGGLWPQASVDPAPRRATRPLLRRRLQRTRHRDGTAGAPIGQAALPWAFPDAAVLGLCPTPAGHKSLARVEHNPGQGQALPGRAPPRARAVSDRLTRPTAFARPAPSPRRGPLQTGRGQPRRCASTRH